MTLTRFQTTLFVFLACFFVLDYLPGLAQEPQYEYYIAPGKRKKLGDREFKRGEYYRALNHYLVAFENDSMDQKLAFRIADTYRYIRDYKQAGDWYERVIGLDEVQFQQARIRYAEMLKMQGRYDDAIAAFSFIVQNQSAPAFSGYAKWAGEEITACRFAKEAIEKAPAEVQAINLGNRINRAYTEFAPVFLGDSMLVFSAYSDDTLLNRHFATRYPLSRMYWSKPKGYDWLQPVALPFPLNNKEFSTGNGSFSPDGKRFYFSQCLQLSNKDIRCDIYLADFIDGVWHNVRPLSKEVNNPRYNQTQPTVAPGGSDYDLLFFSSDRKGGLGGYDIWQTQVSFNGKATEPENLGATINTPGEEVTPFFDSSKNRLYFSTDGRMTMGGKDIYFSEWKENKFGQPQHAGYPINSPADDLYFATTDNEKVNLVVSNRSGTTGLFGENCCDDIFFIKDVYVPQFAVIGTVYGQKEEEDKEPLKGASWEVYEMVNGFKTLVKRDVAVDMAKFDLPLEMAKEYQIRVSKDGFFATQKNVSTLGIDKSDTFRVEFVLKEIVRDRSYTLQNIFYDFNSFKLRDDSKAVLDSLYSLLAENEDIVIELSSHTDSKGNAAYNLMLSQKRAESCVNYLIEKGIDSRRIIPKGYGKTKPVAANFCLDGTDNPDGRQLNRRTEFKVVGTLKNTIILYK